MAKAIVAGLGPSIEGFKPPLNSVSWGLNDIGRYFTPTNLVVLDGPDRFHDHSRRPDALTVIMRTRPRYIWFVRKNYSGGSEKVNWRGGGVAPVSWGARWPGSQIITVELANGLDKSKPITFGTKVPVFHTSAFAATFLAVRSNAPQLLGLIGVDLVDHPDFDDGDAAKIDVQFRRLAEAAEERCGTQIVNLSPISKLGRIPRMTLEEFEAFR